MLNIQGMAKKGDTYEKLHSGNNIYCITFKFTPVTPKMMGKMWCKNGDFPLVSDNSIAY